METDTPHEGPCVYVLALTGDPVNSAGLVIIEIGGISADRARLEALKAEKDAELSAYFDNACTDPMCPGWDGDADDTPADDEEGEDDAGDGHACDKEHPFDGDWCYFNSDYSSCPTWGISSHPLL